ncbi:hypothetical protein [Emticicia sp. W12TSBA100-4]|uniref:hypothetical protein n=1 Tax=Emticicia sp. W12TSBA100-4 TaxID=3160965 RepID=UPI0033056F48
MKKLILLLLLSLSVVAQEKKIFAVDETEKVYVLFVRNDSVGVVYQGKNSAFTADGVYAYNFSAFDMGLKGFIRFDGLKNSIEAAQKNIRTVKTDTTNSVFSKVVNTPLSEISTVAFPKPLNYPKARYLIEAADWVNVSDKKGTITNMQGYDFAPIEMNQGENIYTYKDWNQNYISIKGRDIWKEGNKTYFIKPKGYNTSLEYNLMDFDLKFPDFSLPANKTVVMQPTPKREIGVYNYLRKGVTAVKGRTDKNGFVFVSDEWLTDLGCPSAYTSTKAEMDKWCENVDADALLNSFIERVYYPCRWANVVLLNWEHVGNRFNVRQDKIIKCLEYWKNHEHTAKLGMYAVNGLSLGRPKFQGLNHNYSDLLTFNGTLEQFQKKFNDDVSVDFTYAKYAEIAMIGGYMNYPIEEGILHHYLFELMMHRKFNPNKTILANTWFDMEFISGFDIGRVKVESADGTYFAQVKPKVFPSVAFNWGVWSVAIGDGIDVWSDPNYWDNDKRFWGWGAKDLNMNDLPLKHDEVLAKYPAQPMKAIDWVMSGVYSVSMNKDIIDHSSEWQFVTLPTQSFHDKSVLIAYKIKGNEALVLALDAFAKVDAEKVHEFSINNKKYDIRTFGRFTSVVRLSL